MSVGPLSVVAGGRAPRGWESLWELDAWPFTELPNADLHSEQHGTIRFDRIVQPWLREAAKRWARARLLGSTSPDTMHVYLRDLTVFSVWLAERAPEAVAPAIDRALLEDYLLWTQSGDKATQTRRRYLCVLRQFLVEQCEDGLVGLRAGAVIHRSEMPKRRSRPPRSLERAVFDQFIDPLNLALLGNEQQRTVILVLAHTGLRVSSVVTLARDAVEIGSDGHPYLRYRNVKLKREAMIPIGPVLTDQIRVQQRYLDDAYGLGGTRFLLPSPLEGHRGWTPGRGDGDRHIAKQTVNQIVAKYVRRAEIRSSDGQLATDVHPHLFRHHLGTSLVNDGIALPVIQKVLDHDSTEMTARYAHVADKTVSTALDGWHERVNVRGERIALPIDGPLAQAAWMKDRISRAKQALPNGYCGLPLVQSCPHPNACLSCDHFLTDPSYRHIHQDQLEQTKRLRADAEQAGQGRLIELLAGDEAALTRILTGLDALEADTDPPINLIEIAAGSM